MLQVDEPFEAAEGAQLSLDLVLDKHIGSGSTADVYKIKPAHGGKDNGPTQVKQVWLLSQPASL
jgi:hypothetical protein